MHVSSSEFKTASSDALRNAELQGALGNIRVGFREKRLKAMSKLPEFEALRDRARDIKDRTIAHLDHYLETFEANVVAQGGHVHWCPTAEDARRAVLSVCRAAGVRTVTKGKSMIGEEIELNDFLEAEGVTPVETDLGEYIVQLRRERPSHIIAPVIHLRKPHIAEAFRKHHRDFPEGRDLTENRTLADEARSVLRERFLAADAGITGANFLVAETGASVIVTNEGNGDLTQNLPRVHIVLASIEKIVPTMEDAATLMRVLARSATGQELTAYTTFSAGPRRQEDLDGPDAFHVILLDNGRSDLLGTEFEEMLRCIRCGACLNHCPIYSSVGGHAYGSVYPGPMGSVLSPAIAGLDKTRHLPNASSLCGRCEAVCPVRIPLPKMLRHWREREFERHLTPKTARYGLGIWAAVARRPWLYRPLSGLAIAVLRGLAGRRGRLSALPLAGGWTRVRDLPAPSGPTFMARYRKSPAGRSGRP